MDHAAQHKPISARPWIMIRFGAGLVGALILNLPVSHAANDPGPESSATLEGTEIASLGDLQAGTSGKKPRAGFTSGTVRWGASSFCLDGTLREVINQVAAIFGPVRVNSTCRSRRRNAKVGGAPRSKHLTGDAVDFSVSHNNKPAALSFLQKNSSVGGLKLYSGSNGHFHIDTGPRRAW